MSAGLTCGNTYNWRLITTLSVLFAASSFLLTPLKTSAQSPEQYVNLKVDGSDGPVQVSVKSKPKVTWESAGIISCEIHATDGKTVSSFTALPSSGEVILLLDKFAQAPARIYVDIFCTTKPANGLPQSTAVDRVEIRALGSEGVIKTQGGSSTNQPEPQAPSLPIKAQLQEPTAYDVYLPEFLFVVIFLIATPLFLGLDLVVAKRKLAPLYQGGFFSEKVVLSSLLFTLTFFLLHSLFLIASNIVFPLREETSNYKTPEILFFGLFWSSVTAYFLTFVIASLKWFFKIPKFYTRSWLFFASFVFWNAVSFFLYAMFGERFTQGPSEGFGYLMIGIIGVTPFAILIFAVLGFLLKHFVPGTDASAPPTSQFDGQTKPIVLNGKIPGGFFFRQIDKVSTPLKIALISASLHLAVIFLRNQHLIPKSIGYYDEDPIFLVLAPLMWLEAMLRNFFLEGFIVIWESIVGIDIPLAGIVAFTFIFVIFWKRFFVSRVIRRPRLALFKAVLVYILTVVALVLILGLH